MSYLKGEPLNGIWYIIKLLSNVSEPKRATTTAFSLEDSVHRIRGQYVLKILKNRVTEQQL